MKCFFKKILIFFFCIVCLSNYPVFAAKIDPNDFYNAAIDVYVYGYPLVLSALTKQVMTNVPSAQNDGRAPINQFSHALHLASPADKDIIRPNIDTLYSIAWLDLSMEPLVLSVPDTNDRYYLLPILDAWTDVFASLGKRTTGTKAKNFIIVGPNSNVALPPNIPVIKSSTNMAWITGRTLVTNNEDDIEVARQIQKGYTLTPLSKWGTDYIPPSNLPIDPSIDMTTPPFQQVNMMNGVTFFQLLANALKTNPPHPEDYQTNIIAELKIIGITPGEDFNISTLSNDELNLLNLAAKNALEQIIKFIPKISTLENGWMKANIIGNYGTSYMNRAGVAYSGFGANMIDDAIYLMATTDEKNILLNGTKKYIIHFARNDIPPAKGFWSISLYDSNGLIVPNSINRYALGDRSNMHFNKDGSLDIYLQQNSPGSDAESNWLPLPTENFNLLMRVYWPQLIAKKGIWKPPVISNNF